MIRLVSGQTPEVKHLAVTSYDAHVAGFVNLGSGHFDLYLSGTVDGISMAYNEEKLVRIAVDDAGESELTVLGEGLDFSTGCPASVATPTALVFGQSPDLSQPIQFTAYPKSGEPMASRAMSRSAASRVSRSHRMDTSTPARGTRRTRAGPRCCRASRRSDSARRAALRLVSARRMNRIDSESPCGSSSIESASGPPLVHSESSVQPKPSCANAPGLHVPNWARRLFPTSRAWASGICCFGNTSL